MGPPERVLSRKRNGTSFPCQWHHREQNNSTCRERRGQWRLPQSRRALSRSGV